MDDPHAGRAAATGIPPRHAARRAPPHKVAAIIAHLVGPGWTLAPSAPGAPAGPPVLVSRSARIREVYALLAQYDQQRMPSAAIPFPRATTGSPTPKVSATPVTIISPKNSPPSQARSRPSGVGRSFPNGDPPERVAGDIRFLVGPNLTMVPALPGSDLDPQFYGPRWRAREVYELLCRYACTRVTAEGVPLPTVSLADAPPRGPSRARQQPLASHPTKTSPTPGVGRRSSRARRGKRTVWPSVASVSLDNPSDTPSVHPSADPRVPESLARVEGPAAPERAGHGLTGLAGSVADLFRDMSVGLSAPMEGTLATSPASPTAQPEVSVTPGPSASRPATPGVIPVADPPSGGLNQGSRSHGYNLRPAGRAGVVAGGRQ
jgi:hypothetical protein